MPEYRLSYQRATDSSGNPLAGAKLYAYDAGTTTPADTYTSYLLSTPNSNPIVADSGGLFGAIWQRLSGRMKFVLKTSADVVVFTDDFVEDAGPAILTTRGDVLTRDATAYKRLALGAANTVLGSDGTDLAYITVPLLGNANVWTGASNTFQKTDDGAAAGPTINLQRISTTPAANDALGLISWIGKNSTPADKTYLNAYVVASDVTAGSEDAWLQIDAVVAGSLATGVLIGNGLQVGSPTGGLQGTGTVNATNYYKNGSVLGATAFWCRINAAGTILAQSNVASVVKNSTGSYTFTYTTALASGNYALGGTAFITGGTGITAEAVAQSTTACTVVTVNTSGAGADPDGLSVWGFI